MPQSRVKYTAICTPKAYRRPMLVGHMLSFGYLRLKCLFILCSLLVTSNLAHAVCTWNVSQITYVGYEGPRAACQFWVDRHTALVSAGYSFTGTITQMEGRNYPYYRCELTYNGADVPEGQYEPYTWRNGNHGGCDGCQPLTIELADGSCKPGDFGEGDSCLTLGNPINPLIGNKFQQKVDFIGAGSSPLSVERYYNSLSGNWQFLPQVIPAGLWAETQ